MHGRSHHLNESREVGSSSPLLLIDTTEPVPPPIVLVVLIIILIVLGGGCFVGRGGKHIPQLYNEFLLILAPGGSRR